MCRAWTRHVHVHVACACRACMCTWTWHVLGARCGESRSPVPHVHIHVHVHVHVDKYMDTECTLSHSASTHRTIASRQPQAQPSAVRKTKSRSHIAAGRDRGLRSGSWYCDSISSTSGPLDICLYARCGKHFKRSGPTALNHVSRAPATRRHGQLLGAGQPQRQRGRQGRRPTRKKPGRWGETCWCMAFLVCCMCSCL